MSLRYIISPGNSNETVLTEEDIIRHNPVRTHTGLSDLTATIIEDRTLDSYAQRQDRVNVEVNGDVKWTGYIVGLNHTIGQGTSQLKAEGIAKRLKETRPDYESLGGSLTYNNIALGDALDDYWGRTPFSNYTVTPQTTEQVANDSIIQSADTDTEFSNITSLNATDPLEINGGFLSLLQSCFTTEGENYDNGLEFRTTEQTPEEDIYSGDNSASLVRGPAVTGGPDFAEWNFTLDYTIASEDFGVAVRVDADDTNSAPGHEWVLQHSDGNTYEIDNANTNAIGSSLRWDQIGDGTYNNLDGYQGPDLPPGDYTLRVEVTNSDATVDYALYVDVVAPYDNRFTYTFDDAVDANGYLSGPELYPDAFEFLFTEETAAFNITEANLTLSIDNTSNNQSISLTFDGGSTFTTANNTDTLTTQPSDPSRTVQARVTLSRYGSQTTTPTDGINGQEIDTQEITVDLNDLIVIDGLELSRNHFENLQQLHGYGSNWNWTIEHDSSTISNMTVRSYQQGDVTRAKPDSFEDPESENAEVQAESYFNSIYLQGSLDSGGDRPTAEEKDQDRINNDGREISPGVLRDPKITTEAGARFKALALLETALSNNELVGEKTIPSDTLVDPGYSYPVDFGNGDNLKTLEEVSLTESPTDVNIRARFSTPRSDLSAQIENLQRQGRDRGDSI